MTVSLRWDNEGSNPFCADDAHTIATIEKDRMLPVDELLELGSARVVSAEDEVSFYIRNDTLGVFNVTLNGE